MFVNVAAEKAKAKAAEMRCPLTGLILRDMGDLRNHLRSSAYLQQIDKIDADLVYICDLNGTLSSQLNGRLKSKATTKQRRSRVQGRGW